MQELRLVGVQEDGGHLLLSNEAGEEFSLPVTEALRSAATRPIGRPSARAADAAAGVVTPRDIQARIRAGATAEEVSAESGVDLERVRKYEGPVLAERDWIAHLARQVEVAAPQTGHDLYRSTFGEEPALLGDMVRHRLTSLGMDPATAQWDAWRNPEGFWTISLHFSTDGHDGSASAIGDRSPALWTYRQSSQHLDNQNRWAQVLSELDPLDGPFGGRRLSAVGDRPFNVEEDETPAPAAPSAAPVPRPAVDQDSQDDLLDVLRARRGQRLGVDEDGDDELALMLTRDEQSSTGASRPRLTVASTPSDQDDEADVDGDADNTDDPGDHADGGTSDETSTSRWSRRFGRTTPAASADHDAWAVAEDDAEHDHGEDTDGGNSGDDGAADAAAPEHEAADEQPAPEVHPDQTALDFGADGTPRSRNGEDEPAKSAGDKGRTTGRKPGARTASAKSKRPSVPSWDEIVFGRKGD
ncbi:septation protein SepH [Citricoccus sp.]|uniref:septation protein SepH n=1 Tax=Citricoccus sp. TaxID=1978372 RepID=UPI0028BDDA0F|nr:septation protein SepH [Citricoccus sp.]